MLHKAYDEQICAWLEAHRSEIVAELIALARIPSVRSEPLPGAPFGAECARVLDAAADLFTRLGFAPRTEQ
jgi:succinyl-diaminopimelate desuccinylase